MKIRNYQDDALSKTILYNNIPLASNTRAETVFDTASSESPILQVDQDGDNTFDSQLPPTGILTAGVNYDETAPSTTIKLNGQTASSDSNEFTDSVVVEFSILDNNDGSGVAKVEYTLDLRKVQHHKTCNNSQYI